MMKLSQLGLIFSNEGGMSVQNTFNHFDIVLDALGQRGLYHILCKTLLHVTREFYSVKLICRNLYAIFFFRCEKSLYSQSEWCTAVFTWMYNQSTIA